MRFPADQPYVITTQFNASTHPGIDIAPTPAGSAGRGCYAPENASVYVAGYVAALEGNYVILKGDSGMYYYFGHFANQMMSTGQRVTEGQQIGVLGMTGLATGIHTHHEVRPIPGPGKSIDPVQYYKDKIGGNVASSQDIADETTIRLEYNNALLRDATADEVQNWISNKVTVEKLQRILQTSQEHLDVINFYKKGKAGTTSPATVLKPGTYQVN